MVSFIYYLIYSHTRNYEYKSVFKKIDIAKLSGYGVYFWTTGDDPDTGHTDNSICILIQTQI